METGPVSLPFPDHLDGIVPQWDAPNDGRMDLHEIVCRLVGPIQPVGETHEDNRRLDNIKVFIELTDRLLLDIDDAASKIDSHMASVKAIAKRAADYYTKLGIEG